MSADWLWKRTSYRTETCGEYAVTATEVTGGWEFLAWHRQSEIGSYDNGAAAKQACAHHDKGNGK